MRTLGEGGGFVIVCTAPAAGTWPFFLDDVPLRGSLSFCKFVVPPLIGFSGPQFTGVSDCRGLSLRGGGGILGLGSILMLMFVGEIFVIFFTLKLTSLSYLSILCIISLKKNYFGCTDVETLQPVSVSSLAPFIVRTG